ncbi:MAG: prephenate dehydrogenase/arogenate dehydrogenase family protein [Dokdonella sp.]
MQAFAKVVIVGVGLIGGSLALALRRAGLAEHIVGIDRDADALDDALQLGLIDSVAASAASAYADADLIVMATPVAQAAAVLEAAAAHMGVSTLVTDVGSTKADVVAAARAALGARIAQFVPGHPIAGREIHGPRAAMVDLFDGKRVILTPLEENSNENVDRVRNAWQRSGAQVSSMDVDQHDRVLASVSHLPHLLAYALVAQIIDGPHAQLKLDLAGAGFRDFTRIAASSPEMWRDIVMANREMLLVELDDYCAMLDALRSMIAAGDGDGLLDVFARASRTRLAWTGSATTPSQTM